MHVQAQKHYASDPHFRAEAPTILSDPNPSFKVTVPLESEHLKKGARYGHSFCYHKSSICRIKWCTPKNDVITRKIEFYVTIIYH